MSFNRMYARFKLLDSENSKKIDELELAPKLKAELKSLVSQTCFRIDNALVHETKLDIEHITKIEFPLALDYLLRDVDSMTRTEVLRVFQSIGEKMQGRYYTSLVAGFCTITGQPFLNPAKRIVQVKPKKDVHPQSLADKFMAFFCKRKSTSASSATMTPHTEQKLR